MQINQILIKKTALYHGLVFLAAAVFLLQCLKAGWYPSNSDKLFGDLSPFLNWIFPSSVKSLRDFKAFDLSSKNGVDVEFMAFFYIVILVFGLLTIIMNSVTLILNRKAIEFDSPKIFFLSLIIFLTDYFFGGLSRTYSFSSMYVDEYGIFIIKFTAFYGIIFYFMVIIVTNIVLLLSIKLKERFCL